MVSVCRRLVYPINLALSLFFLQDGLTGRFSQSPMPNGRKEKVDGTGAEGSQRWTRIQANNRTRRSSWLVEGKHSERPSGGSGQFG